MSRDINEKDAKWNYTLIVRCLLLGHVANGKSCFIYGPHKPIIIP